MDIELAIGLNHRVQIGNIIVVSQPHLGENQDRVFAKLQYIGLATTLRHIRPYIERNIHTRYIQP